VQEGLEFKWDQGVTTGVTYRRRDVNEGTGDHDDGVWFEFSFPVWKAEEKPDSTAHRLEALEKRLAELEAGLGTDTGPDQAQPLRRTGER
jgi:hypothetical protein